MRPEYNSTIHNRRSIRLKDYDYSQEGYYFITICTKNRELLLNNNFVKIMINKWWNTLPNKFSNVETDEFIIMPNHIHGIIIIVGADQCVCPKDQCVCPKDQCVCPKQMGEHTFKGEHIGSPLHKIVQWFKTMTTNEYIQNVKTFKWNPFPGKLWQRNYYEHIIRNENELKKIREYIANNPLKWQLDQNNPKNVQYKKQCKPQ